MSRRWIIALVVVVAVALAAVLSAVRVTTASGHGSPPTYLVTVTNLTDGQPMTPPVVAIHRRPVDLFDIGRQASFELKEIAENGNIAPMLARLDPANNRHVADVQSSAPEPIVLEGSPGEATFATAQAFVLTGGRGANYLSIASMLICTNDGFTGVDSLRLPGKVGESTTVFTAGYDAGTEMNTEDFADIVPPCQGLIGVSSADDGTGMSNAALAENGVIGLHPGIAGGADLLPDVHGWVDPV
ncbi:MAG: spondin domain-containing protein, partial [Gaiellales bacterium]